MRLQGEKLKCLKEKSFKKYLVKGEGAQTTYTHVSKCKNDKIKGGKTVKYIVGKSVCNFCDTERSLSFLILVYGNI
jgi:hypothetical protein